MKYLPLAALLFAGCNSGEPVVRADDVEIIHVDAQAGMINMTVSDRGQRTTISFTPGAALKAQSELSRTILLLTGKGAEVFRAPPASADPGL